MEDFEMTLEVPEAAKIRFWLGEIPSTSVGVFVYVESKDRASISISIEGEERFVVDISDRGNRINVVKSPNQAAALDRQKDGGQ